VGHGAARAAYTQKREWENGCAVRSTDSSSYGLVGAAWWFEGVCLALLPTLEHSSFPVRMGHSVLGNLSLPRPGRCCLVETYNAYAAACAITICLSCPS
jgi:hypothetical protein